MKLFKSPVFYPFFILILIFLFDKISYWEDFRNRGRAENTGLENIRDGADLIWDYRMKEKSKENTSDSKEKTVVIFGTSRSERLKFTSESMIRDSPFLNSEAKAFLKNFDLETRLTDRGSEFLYNYYLLQAMLLRGFKPDLILIEVSPEMLNSNSPSGFDYQVQTNRFPISFLIEMFETLPWPERSSLLTALLFPSAYYKVQPERAVSNWIRGKDYRSDNIIFPMLLQFPTRETLSSEYEDVPLEDSKSSLYKERIVKYADSIFEGYFLKDYQFSESEYKFFRKILDLVQSSGIPTVFWRPQIHPYYHSQIQKRIPTDSTSLYKKEIESRGLLFYNLQEETLSCQAFSDASHLSSRCSPELIFKLLNFAKKANPGL